VTTWFPSSSFFHLPVVLFGDLPQVRIMAQIHATALDFPLLSSLLFSSSSSSFFSFLFFSFPSLLSFLIPSL
jgi:hypothetical protein